MTESLAATASRTFLCRVDTVCLWSSVISSRDLNVLKAPVMVVANVSSLSASS